MWGIGVSRSCTTIIYWRTPDHKASAAIRKAWVAEPCALILEKSCTISIVNLESVRVEVRHYARLSEAGPVAIPLLIVSSGFEDAKGVEVSTLTRCIYHLLTLA